MKVLNKSTKRKSKFSKKSKKTWRITEIKDVEDFYENKLLEERLGGPFSEKHDDELFFIEKTPVDEKQEKKKTRTSSKDRKKLRSLEAPRCFTALENTSKVPDPISKRNRVRTKEERKSSIQKAIEEKLRSQGIIKKKEIMAAKNRLLDKKRSKQKPKPYLFNKDVWKDEKDEENVDWLDKDTVRHYLTNTGQLEVKTPMSIYKKPSVLPSVEFPHPGTSYNPSTEDHRNLLQIVVDKEEKMLKAEAHLDRVTTKMFSKISNEEVLNNWIAEMGQGLNEEPTDHDKDDSEYKPLNPPAKLNRKPLKKKKKAKLLKKEKLEKEKKVVEKKKIADLYKLRSMQQEIKEAEENSSKLQEKRKQMKIDRITNTKRLGRNKFAEPLLEFQRLHELKKNLRQLNPEGNMLTDRFFNLQKRNIIEPRRHRSKNKTKVKVFKRPGFKEEDIQNDYVKLKLDS